MITAVLFMLFLGLIVFGPKKTVEIAQTIGRLMARVKRATSEFQTQIQQEVCAGGRNEDRNNGGSVSTKRPGPERPTSNTATRMQSNNIS